MTQPDTHCLIIAQPASTEPLADSFAALFALANGLIGIRGSIEELAQAPDLIVRGAFVTRPIGYHEAFPGYASATETRVLCPSPVALRVALDGQPVDMARAKLVDFERHLDLAQGMVWRRAEWQLPDGRRFAIEAWRLVPLNGGPIVASRVRFVPIDFAATVTLMPEFGTGADVSGGDANDPRISARLVRRWHAEQIDPATARFTSGELTLTYRQTVTAHAPGAADGALSAALGAGDAIGYDRIVAASTGAGEALPLPRFAALVEDQKAAIAAWRDAAACTIPGNRALERAIAFNQFQVLQSASRDSGAGTAAKGLTGDGYEGHTFWDAEAFLLPALVFAAPERARALIGWRVATLDAARANARLLGFRRGAAYPWRTIAGRECSSHYPTGAAQLHINADIAWALKLYVDATGDRALLNEAAEMLFETARIWMQVGRFDPARGGAFTIHGVTGPDEYTALVDNDYYTNAAARAHLGFAAAVAHDWTQAAPEAFAALASRIALGADEPARWRQAAEAMWSPSGGETCVAPQDDQFLARPRFPHPLRVPGRPLLLDHHPMTLFRHQVCKQGDVIQALAMDLVDLSYTRQAANYAYYEPITSHDSTLSAPAFATVAARIGNWSEAERFLDEAAFVDLENRHHNTDHGLHMAALAGSWTALATGWAGIAVRDGVLHFRPQTSPALAAYALRLRWRGSVIAIEVDGEGATYRLISGAPVVCFDQGRAVRVADAPVRMAKPTLRALIFDLDGVLTDTAEDHFLAWAAVAAAHGLRFDRALNERLKGVDRAGSLRLILEASGASMSDAAFAACLAEKNAIYRERLEAYRPDNLFAGVADLFAAARAAGLRIALASASRNAPDVVARLGIADQFDFIADPRLCAPKPAPDLFLACAAALGVAPATCVGIEDAEAGIAAIRTAGMTAIGIGAPGSLPDAALSLTTIGDLTLGAIHAVHAPE